VSQTASTFAHETIAAGLATSATDLAQGQPAQTELLAHMTFDGIVLSAGGTEAQALLDEVPTDSIISGIDSKVTIDGTHTSAVGLQVAAPNTGKRQIALDTDAPGIAHTAQAAHDLDGALAQGTGTIALVALDAALAGHRASVSLAVHYRATLALPELRSGGVGARPEFHRLPAAATKRDVQKDNDDKLAQAPGSPALAAGWETIKYESFEGAFPNNGWSLYDTNNDGLEYFWDDDAFKPYAGGWSAWPANGGANSLSPATNNYPNNMDSWMIYGPFDLSTAGDAQTVFQLWRAIETGYDYAFFGTSGDGTNFNGYSWDGNVDWAQITVGYADRVGDNSVWVGWLFHSDGSVTDKGPFVDEITISKRAQAACGTALAASDTTQAANAANQAAISAPPSVMPIHPDLLARARRGEITLAPDTALQQKGINQPQQASQPRGNWKGIALLVQFTDNLAQVGATSFDTLLFGGGFGSLTHYYNTVSYGTLNIVSVNLPSSIGWCRMPRTYAYYVNGQKGFGAYPQNAQKMAEDAVAMADPLVDFSQYDNDQDGYVDTVFILHAGTGFEFTGNVNQIHSHSWETYNDPIVDGVRVNSYTTEPEYWNSPGDITVGVFAHELGHAFGLPDLYDTDASSQGLGVWSLMASGSWNGSSPGGGSPAFLDAWSRQQLGFVTPTVVTNNLNGASITAAETSSTVYRLWTNGNAGSEYFLVENRQKTSYDAALPSAGLLIWHVDNNRDGNYAECRQINNWLCGVNHYKVALEQADGLLGLENNTSIGDGGDPYPGSANNRSFTFTTTPNSSSYANSTNTLVGVTNISNSGPSMTANFQVRSGSGPTNLLVNPSFDIDTNGDNRPDSWTSNSKFTRSSAITAHNGSYVGQFRATDNSGATIKQTVGSLSAGTTYNFSGWVYVPTTSDTFTLKLQVQWKKSDNTTISTTTVATFSNTSQKNVWLNGVKSMTAPAGTAKAIVMLKASSLNTTVYVDDLVFQQ
jgi:immune inhibitor A